MIGCWRSADPGAFVRLPIFGRVCWRSRDWTSKAPVRAGLPLSPDRKVSARRATDSRTWSTEYL